MCGISGIISPGPKAESLEAVTLAMADTLAHRGPDASGVWTDPETRVGLGHRRLSILELSPLGAQPMHSQDGRFVLVYNGEVYNHLELRPELEAAGCRFQGTSDTETILAALAHWGVISALKRFVGMFAFALWDRKERVLTLARDRLGIKPLYYGHVGGDFVFGSELKALRAHPRFDNPVDPDILALFFRHNYVPAPYCIHQGLAKLEAGRVLTLRTPEAEPVIKTWWSLDHIRPGSLDLHPDEACETLRRTLLDSVRLRLLSDVPLGALLSGGVDSSLVAALMCEAGSGRVKTFSIGFSETAYDESAHARAVARRLGTEHTEMTLGPDDLLAAVPQLPDVWDEPFSDSSQVPTLCVFALARKHVTVALSGDGGDELFLGYDRYRWGLRWRGLSHTPLALRRLGAEMLRLVPARAFDLIGPLGRKLRWRTDLLACRNFDQYYKGLLSHWLHHELVPDAREPATLFDQSDKGMDGQLSRMSRLDLAMYLPDDILTKVDRASMAVGLEARVPLLDHRVAELAAALPVSLHWRDNQGKRLLRHVLEHYLPIKLFDRPKQGFAVPIRQWLRAELRDWAESLLARRHLEERGLLDADRVRCMWQGYLTGREEYSDHLWDVLMFQAWLQRWEGSGS